MDFGHLLKTRREIAGLSQEGLAEVCGWGKNQRRISNYENNRRQPSLDDVALICTALGMSLSEYFSPIEEEVDEREITKASFSKLSPKKKAEMLKEQLTPDQFRLMAAAVLDSAAKDLGK